MTRHLKRITDLILYSSLFIAACALGLVWETYLLLNDPVSVRVGLMVFFATLFLYNLDSLTPYKFNQQVVMSEKKQWLHRHRQSLIGVTLIAAVAALLLLMRSFTLESGSFLVHLAFISLLYSLPVIPHKGRFRPLRSVPLLKVFLIAYVWMAVTVALPVLQLGLSLWQPEVVLLLMRRFAFIFALTLLFDIRDYTKDRLLGTVTFPGVLGIRKTKWLAWGALLVFAVLVPYHIPFRVALALEFSAVLAGVVVYFAEEKRPEYYFAICADGMMLVQFLIVLAFS